MNDLKAVYWDVDGTLADTEIYGHRIAFNMAFKDFELDWDWDINLYKTLLEVSGGFNRIEKYSQHTDCQLEHSKILEIHKIKQQHYAKILNSGNIPLRLGVARMLIELNVMGVEQWIVTTSSRKAIEALLNSSLTKYQTFFKGIVSFEDVANTKPDPEAYLKVSKLSKINKNNVVVIEDSLIGLKAAKTSGHHCLITKSPWSHDNMCNYTMADAVVDSLGDSTRQSSIFHGPYNESTYIDYKYLVKLIN